MRRSCRFLLLLLATMLEIFGNNSFNVSSVSNKCLCLLKTSLTCGPRGLNSAENITGIILMERFFFFLATERYTFSIFLNVGFTVYRYVLLRINKMNILLLYFDISPSWNISFLNEGLHLFGYR